MEKLPDLVGEGSLIVQPLAGDVAGGQTGLDGLPESRAACEDVDGEVLGFVFVRWLPPAKLFGPEVVNGCQHGGGVAAGAGPLVLVTQLARDGDPLVRPIIGLDADGSLLGAAALVR